MNIFAFNEPLYNKVLGIKNDILQPSLLECMEQNCFLMLFDSPGFTYSNGKRLTQRFLYNRTTVKLN